jgi:hypothetical protein
MAASLFSKPRVVGVVGEDFPESVLGDLKARNIDTTGVERARVRPSAGWVAMRKTSRVAKL